MVARFFVVARVFVPIVLFSVFQRQAKDEEKCDNKEILGRKEKRIALNRLVNLVFQQISLPELVSLVGVYHSYLIWRMFTKLLKQKVEEAQVVLRSRQCS